MIVGVVEVLKMMEVLTKLELGFIPAVGSNIADYAVGYGASNSVAMWDSNDNTLDDELLEMSEEEVRIMNSYNPGYEHWYMGKFDEILLGDEDE